MKTLKLTMILFRLFKKPLIFNDFLNQIKKISFKNEKSNNKTRIGKFIINFQTYELTNNSEKKFYKLLELENKFLRFLYKMMVAQKLSS